MKEKKFAVNALIRKNRSEFNKDGLSEEALGPDPFVLFEHWLTEALLGDPAFGNAMTLSTVGKDQVPDSRTVLLRNISYGGFTFYTNYQSKKGEDIATHRFACLNFFWKEQMRQVKVQGEVKFLPPRESDNYFEQRPFESQVGAWASQQSQPVKSRSALDKAFDAELKKYRGKEVPRPAYWGGYVLLPSLFEFWQGRTGRLHDRIRYTRNTRTAGWNTDRLMP